MSGLIYKRKGLIDLMRDDNEKLISKKATYHMHCKVHITLKDDTWENGWIEEVEEDRLLLKLTEEGASKLGVRDKVFFFLEIKDINEFTEGLK